MKKTAFWAFITGAVLTANTPAQEPQSATPADAGAAPSERREPGDTLTAEQRQKLREEMDRIKKEREDLMIRMRAARMDLEKAIQDPASDEKRIRELANAVGKVESDFAVLRAQEYKTITAMGFRRPEMKAPELQRSTNPFSLNPKLEQVIRGNSAIRPEGAPPKAKPAPPAKSPAPPAP